MPLPFLISYKLETRESFSDKSPISISPHLSRARAFLFQRHFYPMQRNLGNLSSSSQLGVSRHHTPHPIQPPLLSLQYSLLGFSQCSHLLFPSATDWGATTEIYWAHYPYFKNCVKECMNCVPGKGLHFVWPQK